jgi:arylsulfatase A-like enzyme
MEGKSLLGVCKGEPLAPRTLFWEHEGHAAARRGDLKLVRSGRDGAWELYDMQADRAEQNNLAAAQPGKAKELAAEWEAWAKRAQVIPYPGRAQGKKGKAKTGE